MDLLSQLIIQVGIQISGPQEPCYNPNQVKGTVKPFTCLLVLMVLPRIRAQLWDTRIVHGSCYSRSSRVEYEWPPTPKPTEEGKLAELVPGPCSNLSGVYCNTPRRSRYLTSEEREVQQRMIDVFSVFVSTTYIIYIYIHTHIFMYHPLSLSIYLSDHIQKAYDTAMTPS